MAKQQGRDGDGLEYLGVRNGKKTWKARITYVDPRTGKKRDTKAVFAAGNKLEALQERNRRIELKKSGVASASKSERKRFSEAADSWFKTLATKGTKISWGSHMRGLVRDFGDWWLDAVTTEDVQRHLDKHKHLSAGVVNAKRTVAIKIYEHAIRKKWVSENPAETSDRRNERSERAKLQALQKPPKRSLTLTELEAVMGHLREKDPDVWLIAATQFVLGQRFAEVSAIWKADIDWETSEVWTRRGQVAGEFGPTKGRYARLGAVGQELLGMLKAHVARMEQLKWPGWEELLFPRPPNAHKKASNAWSYWTVRRAYQMAFKRCGIPVKTATHVMRRAMVDATREEISNQLQRRLVGHADQEQSLRYTEAQLAEVINIADYLTPAIVGRRSGSGTFGGTPDHAATNTPRKD